MPAKPLHNYDIVSVHFSNFYCIEICDRDLVMLTYIYLNVEYFLLTSAMQQLRFKFQILLNYAVILKDFISEDYL